MNDRRTFINQLTVGTASCLMGIPSGMSSGMPSETHFRGRSSQLLLSDGRRLGYVEYGTADGVPVLYLHGLPASKLEARAFDAEARSTGCRIIAIDRPGIGHSDPLPGRSIEDWPRDIAEVVTHFGFGEFYIIGFSSGAPYAIACAIAFSKPGFAPQGVAKLARVIVTSGLAPPTASLPKGISEPFWNLVRRRPDLSRRLLDVQTRAFKRNPDRVMTRVTSRMSCPSRRISLDPFYRQIAIEAYLDAVRCGSAGLIEDARILAFPWNLSIGDCRLPVDFWYGRCDRITQPAIGEYWSRKLVGSRLFVLNGEGHYSTPVGNNARLIIERSILGTA